MKITEFRYRKNKRPFLINEEVFQMVSLKPKWTEIEIKRYVFSQGYTISDGRAMNMIHRFISFEIKESILNSLIFYNQSSFFQKLYYSLSGRTGTVKILQSTLGYKKPSYTSSFIKKGLLFFLYLNLLLKSLVNFI